jgi:hypothetical protein
MKKNKIQIIISNVRHNQISVGAVEFSVQMKNSVDDINTWPNNRDDTKGYLERSELEDKLEEFRRLVIEEAECTDMEVILK